MSAICVEKIAHDKCGSSDAVQVFVEDGKYTAYCFNCGTYIPDPYSDKEEGYAPKIYVKSDEEVQAELAEIASCPSYELVQRALRKRSLDYFGIKVGVSEQDGTTPSVVYFPFTKGTQAVGYKARLLAEKKMWSYGEMSDVDLFGWQQAISTGARTLFITEGEYDTVALYQAIKETETKEEYKHLNPAVVSLTKGAGGVKKDLTRAANSIKGLFQDVVLVFDQDEAGQKAVELAVQILPEARSVTLPDKDPNACVMSGRSKALRNAVLFRNTKPKNSRVIRADSLFEQAAVAPEMGMSWPWEGMTRLTRGLRFGETIYIGAGVKMGKSEIVNSLAVHLMRDHNLKVYLAKPEEANLKTVKLVAGKYAGKFFHDPTKPFDRQAYVDATKEISDKLYLLSLYQHVGWSTLRSDIIDAVQNNDCKAVFIDPITNLTNGLPPSEANTKLQDIAQDLAALAKDLDILVFIFCHLKAPDSGDSHERGGKVFSSQFSGSRAMMRSCNYMLGMEGNKDPDLPLEERNMRRLVLLEDREFGESGIVNLYWDHNTGLFLEVK